MISSALIALVVSGHYTTLPPSVAWLDAKVQSRDIAAIRPLLLAPPKGHRDPLQVIVTNGGYAVGAKGWHALGLKSPSGRAFVVFATPLTAEDIGELLFERVGKKLRFVPETDAMGIRPVRHHFDLSFDVEHKRAILVDNLDIKSTGKGDFVFRMSPQYRVRSLRLDGKGNASHPVRFSQSSGVVVVQRPYGPTFRLKVAYDGVVDLPQYAGYMTATEASLVNDYWYPMIARWPAPYDIALTTKAKWTAVAQGERVSETVVGNRKITRYRMDLPCVFYSCSAGDYRTFSRKDGGLEFRVWSQTMSKIDMEIQTNLYPPILRFYQQFGKFPFSGYGALDSAQYGGGALEAYSYATYGGNLPDEDAHEPSHTWFGGILNNDYLKSYWNESFANFCDGMYHRNVPIGNVAERRLAYISDASASPSYDQFSCADSGSDVGPVSAALGYGKGAVVLQMLEQTIGTPRLITCMHRWIVEHPKGTPASWEGFERAANRQCPDAHLQDFFAGWIHGSGSAHLSITDIVSKPGHLTFRVQFSGRRFRIPLEGLVLFADGSRQWFSRDLKVKDSLGITVQIPSRKIPMRLVVDPWRRILRPISSDESPISLRRVLPGIKRYNDPKHPDYLAQTMPGGTVGMPKDFNGAFLVGSPETEPSLRPLFDKVGFHVSGDKLMFDGTTIDLQRGGALAVVELGDDKRCVIGIGKVKHRPSSGQAKLMVVDEYGRFLRGRTDPKTEGNLTYPIR